MAQTGKNKMKWITQNTWVHEKQRKSCWHFWFAWYPVRIKSFPDGAVEKIWLKKILRKGEYYCSYDYAGWEYQYKEWKE